MSFLLRSDKYEYFLLPCSFSVLFNSISLSLLCFLLSLCVFALLHLCLPVSVTRQHSGSLLLIRNTGSITFATKAHTVYQWLWSHVEVLAARLILCSVWDVFWWTPLETIRNFFRYFALLVGAFGSIKCPAVGVWKNFLAKLFQPSSRSEFSQVQGNLRTAMHYDTTIKPEAGPPFPTRIKISPFARLLLASPAQKLCRYEHDKVSASRCVRAAAVRILTEVRSHAVTRALDTGISWNKQQFDDSQSVKTLFMIWPEGSEQLRHTAHCQIQPSPCAEHKWLSAV
jgi:hypothetical protein